MRYLTRPKNTEVEGLGQMGCVRHEEPHCDPVCLQEPLELWTQVRRAPVEDEKGSVVEVPAQFSQRFPLVLDGLEKNLTQPLVKKVAVKKLFLVDITLTLSTV